MYNKNNVNNTLITIYHSNDYEIYYVCRITHFSLANTAQESPIFFIQIGILLFILTVGKLTIVSSSATQLHGNDKKKLKINI